MDGHWIHSWASVPQRVEPADRPLAPADRGDRTLRQTVRASIGGRRLRLHLSNAFGPAALDVSAMTVARPAGGRAGTSALQPATVRPVPFAGRPGVRIAAGGRAVTDSVDVDVAPGEVLTVSIHLADGGPDQFGTGHPRSRTTSYLAAGDQIGAVELSGAVAVEQWYVLSGLELWSDPAARAAVMLGDSLTDGRGSTTNGNDRWPDRLLDRLQSDPTTAQVAIVNQAAGGNRVLRDGIGPSALSRVEDVLALTGVAWLFIFHGVNDIGTAAPAAPVTGELIDAYARIIDRAHANGVRVYGATLTPFGGHDGYDDPAGVRAASRLAVNDWIRTTGLFDAVSDFDRAVRDPVWSDRLRPAFDGGDHLHLNPAGYQALADAVPTSLFRSARPRWPSSPGPR